VTQQVKWKRDVIGVAAELKLDCWGVAEESEFGPNSVDLGHRLVFPCGNPTDVGINVSFCVTIVSQVRKSSGQKCRGYQRSTGTWVGSPHTCSSTPRGYSFGENSCWRNSAVNCQVKWTKGIPFVN
jgi:hypothetical protein